MSADLLDLDMERMYRAHLHHLKLLTALSQGEPVRVAEYYASFEAVFGTPPPEGSEEDHHTANLLFDAVTELTFQYATDASVSEAVRRKFETPHGLIILLTTSMLASRATAKTVNFNFVGTFGGREVFSITVAEHEAGGGKLRRQMWWENGPWLSPFLEHWRTLIPAPVEPQS